MRSAPPPRRRPPSARALARACGLLGGLTAAWAGSAAGAMGQERYNTEAYRRVTGALTCQCGGCNAIVSECAMDRCPSSNPIREETAERLKAGETPEAVIARFRDRYGLSVLAAPPAAGFHLTAWMLPGVVLLLGGAAAALVIRRWRQETPAPAAPAADAAANAAGAARPEVLARIERDIADLR